VVLGQNAIMLSKPTVAFLAGNISFTLFISLFAVACINLLTVTANWLSSRMSEKYYNKTLFLNDIGTLIIFATFTQVLIESYKDENLIIKNRELLFLYAISYLIIYISFVLWNLSVRAKEDKRQKKIVEFSIFLNLLVILSLTSILIYIYLGTENEQYNAFALSVILQFIVLFIYYAIALITPRKKMHHKQKAQWIGSRERFIKQIKVSIISYFKRPFVQEKKEAVKDFWTREYNNPKDELIFDGSNQAYLNKLIPILNQIDKKNGYHVIDLCAGNGNLYCWIKKEELLNIEKYIGIDFAIEPQKIDDNSKLIKFDITDADAYTGIEFENSIAFVTNGFCYCTDDAIKNALKNISCTKYIIILEPLPGIFWDACFEGIILRYRNKKKWKQLLKLYGFELEFQVTDYLLRVFGFHFCALSRAYLFVNK